MQSDLKHRTHKRCPACEQTLPRTKFAKNRNRADGLHAYCLACNRQKQAEERARRGDDYREMRRRYRSTPTGRAAYARYRKTHTAKAYAHSLVQNAISNGKLIRPDLCEVCGESGLIDSHHDDYAKPMEIRWLCRWCHQEWHRIHGEAANADIVPANAGRMTRWREAKAARMPLVAEMYAAGMSQAAIARHFGVSQATIGDDLRQINS